jgi:SAM-dependent methyltransferase
MEYRFKSRSFYHCTSCHLIFANPESRPDLETEKKRYLHHQNEQTNDGYISFLNQMVDPLINILDKNTFGLDYGCGPNPVLAEMMRQKGYRCAYYDPIFFPKELTEKYDFVVATECFEHFFYPKKEIEKIDAILKPNGNLAIRTNTWTKHIPFNSWHYIRDWTHVCFYHDKTFEWICQTFGYEMIYKKGKNVFILQKI